MKGIGMANEKSAALSDVAYKYILERIISFDYKPNEPIVEGEICEHLGISRTPLREALRRLEAEGFIIKARNRGAFVRTYTAEDISESCDIRCLFEVYSLDSCIKHTNKEEVEGIKEKLTVLTKNSSEEEFYTADKELHGMITRYCMNTRMLNILKTFSVQLDIFQRISAQTPNRLMESKEEHLKIVEAIKERNLPEAQRCLKQHLENVKKSSIQAFQRMRVEKIGV